MLTMLTVLTMLTMLTMPTVLTWQSFTQLNPCSIRCTGVNRYMLALQKHAADVVSANLLQLLS